MAKSKLETIQEQTLGYLAAVKAVEATKPKEVAIELVPENLEELEEKLGCRAGYASLAYNPFDNRFCLTVNGSSRVFPDYIAKPLINALRDFIEEDANAVKKT